MHDPQVTVHDVAYHRNGVGGAGFYAVSFTWLDQDSDVAQDHERTMLGIVFSEGDAIDTDSVDGRIAVIDTELAAQQWVGYGNTFRGNDTFGPRLIEAVADYELLREAGCGV